MVAAALSLAVHATAAMYFGHYPSPEAAAAPSTPTLQLSLVASRPPVQEAVPDPAPEPAPQPEIRPPPKPVPIPASAHVTRPKPRPQPPARRPPPAKVAKTVEPVPEQTATATPTEAVTTVPVRVQDVSVNERENYLARLLAHIDSHKFYPRSARRRGVTGEVKVSFYLLSDGGIRDLQVTGGNKLLRRAARQAIQKALSLPLPPESLGLREPVRFGMVYRLDG